MDDLKLRKTIKRCTNLEPDKIISSLSVIQFYKLIRFSVARTISHESDD